MRFFNIMFFPILALLILGCTSTSPMPPPAWFDTCHFPDLKPNEIIGCGEGQTQEQAENRARAAISRNLFSKVKSIITSEEIVRNEEYDLEATVKSIVESEMVQTDVTIKKQELKGDHWYVAMIFENLPFAKKFANRVENPNCAIQQQNRYLSQTPLIQDLNQEFKCPIQVDLIRNHGLWYLFHEDIGLVLRPDIFVNLLVSSQSETLSLSTPQTDFFHQDLLTFEATSTKSGFISLLNVYENGKVTWVESNQPIKSGQILPLPNAPLQTVVLNDRRTYDLYVAVLSEHRLDWSRFTVTDEQIATEERDNRFAELLEVLDQYDFSTLLIQTWPKQN